MKNIWKIMRKAKESDSELLNKYLWVMFWWACWDALGSATEFLTPDKFDYVEDFQWRWKFRSKPWDYTDDTAQALCLAQSLLDCKWFDIEDQLDKYLMWFKDWYMSSQDRAFWIWMQTADRLYKYKQYKEWIIKEKPREEDLSWKKKDWNWCLMKIWSIPLFYYSNPKKALFYAWESCKAMHNTDICISSAEYFVWLVIWALQWESKETLSKPDYSPVKNYWESHKIHEKLLPIVKGSYNLKNESELWFSWHYWYVVDSLEIALRWFFKFDTFEEWMVKIVNLGNDADTNACIYWYLAWAYYGYDNIPSKRKDNVTNKWLIKDLAKWLYSQLF